MTFVRVSGGTVLEVTRANNSGVAMILGEIAAQPTGAPDEITACNVTSDVAASRPVGIVVNSGGIPNTQSGLVNGTQGRPVEVAMVATLTPTLGEEVIVSTTNGLGTIPGSGVSEPTAAGTAVQRVGVITDISAYAGSQRVKINIDFSQRRIN